MGEISLHGTLFTYLPLFAEKEYRAVVMIYVKDATEASTQQLTSRTVDFDCKIKI